jgi:hypothetical protein
VRRLAFILLASTLPAVSAARAECRLFEHKSFLGGVVVLSNNQSLNHLGALNDRVSSIIVTPQCLLVAYADPEYQGATTAFSSGEHASLPDGWDDRISSARCNCR